MRKLYQVQDGRNRTRIGRKLAKYINQHNRLIGSVIFLCLLIGFALASRPVVAPPIQAESKQQDSTATDLSWLKIPGSTYDFRGLHIAPLDEMIVNQDGTGGQANPPVNLTGPHFAVTGDFKIDASFTGAAEGGAVLQYYAAPPVIYDEWRLETPSARIEIATNSFTVSIWDGSGERPVKTTKFTVNEPVDHMFMESGGGNLTFYSNSKKIGSLADHGIFASGQVWVGADAKANGPGWYLTDLHITGSGELVAAPPYDVSHTDANALRNLAMSAKNPVKIGAAIALGPLMSDDAYRSLAGSQFSMLTPENAMKAQFIHPSRNVYNFDEADALVAFAQANDMAVHGHALVFGEANPRWMQDTPADQREQMMIDHIQKIVEHYKGKVAEWDVVNEPLADNEEDDETSSDIRNSIWFQSMGEEFIDKAFTAVRAADPAAKLYMNEFGLEEDGDRWDSMIDLIGRLQSRGVPIDGIGFQSHVYEAGDHEDPAVLRSHIRQLAELGLSSRISEIDVHGDSASVQANEYAGILGACLAEPSCTSFTTWGITDWYGSTTEIRAYPREPGDDLLWDEHMQPKPALMSLQQVLKQAK